MTGHPNTPAHPPGTSATRATGLAGQLRAATDEQLAAILAADDEADIAAHQPGGRAGGRTVARAAPGTVEIVLLGALGCRYGMLAGGAGGYLLRTPSATVLVDPGPAAPGMLAELDGRVFSWAELTRSSAPTSTPTTTPGSSPAWKAWPATPPPASASS